MSIDLYMGCMYSGKTSQLIAEYRRWSKIGKKIICINYEGDTRYDMESNIFSHNKETITSISAKKLMDAPGISEYDIIMINEGQFFPDLIEFCKLWCDINNRHIIVCGLDGDFEREPMGEIHKLIPLSDNVTKFKALCNRCNNGTPAIFSKRKSTYRGKIEIGTEYIPVCRYHYNN